MQPPSDRRRTTAAQLTRSFHLPGEPLVPILLAAVVAIGGALVALVLLPLFGTLGMSVNALNHRIHEAGAGVSIRIPHFPERSTIYAKDGTVLATLYLDENRDIVHLGHVAEIAQKAVLAIEDDGFYQHGGINVPSMLRAMAANLIAGRVTQGGSTITQQLVKNAVIENTQQTFARKFREAAIAMRMENRYTKDQILEMYLNDVYFGNSVYGIGTAARYYFAEPASRLSLSQGALLAGIIQAPSDYDPVAHPKAAERRRNTVLDHMESLGWITTAEAGAARARPLGLAPAAGRSRQRVQPFFVYYLRNLILDDANHQFDAFGKTREQRIHTLYQGGLKIFTTLDPAWQRYAQEAVDQSPSISMTAGPDVSLVSVDTHTGAIRAMLSGKDYQRDQLDLVWRGTRQVGSAFKPFTLVAALEQHVPTGTVYSSRSPYCSAAWTSADHCVSNAESGDRGYIDLWTATQDSVNVVFAQLALDIGPSSIVDAAHTMGITAPLQAVPSITLGTEDVSTLDMASAYSALANDGTHCAPFAIVRVDVPGGGTLYRHKPTCEQAISQAIAHQVTAMLQRVVCCGTGTAANIGRPVAGKTGTAQDYTNVYFAGYTPQVATAVWVGFSQGQIPMESYYGHSVYGGTLAAPIWHAFMAKATAGMPVESFPAPPPQPSGTVPDIVGMRSLEAQQAIDDAHFTPIVVKVDSVEAVNTVLEQSPAAGTRLALGGGVKITVSNGKGKGVAVPHVVGMKQDAAVKALEDAGLVAKVKLVDVGTKQEQGVVIAQDPVASTQVDRGSTVVVQVGRAPAPATTAPAPGP
ncbi:MAG: transglycosylase domain-containing protein [Actinomycetota bacterium]